MDGKGKGKPVTVMKFGCASVPVYRLVEGNRVRFLVAHYRDGKRLRQTFRTLEAAKKEAKFVAQRIQSGMQHVTDLKPHERDSYVKAVDLLAELDIPLVAAVEDYVQARKLADGESLASIIGDYRKVFRPLSRRAKVPEIVAELFVARTQDGASRQYLSNLRTVLHRFAAAFPDEILTITSSDIDGWLRGLCRGHDQHGAILTIAFAAKHDAGGNDDRAVDEMGSTLEQDRTADAIGIGFQSGDTVDGGLDLGTTVLALGVGHVAHLDGLVGMRVESDDDGHHGNRHAAVPVATVGPIHQFVALVGKRAVGELAIGSHGNEGRNGAGNELVSRDFGGPGLGP